jgi:MFS family permease
MAIGESRAPSVKPNKWVALTVVCLIVFVICINTTAINTAVATIADDLSLSTSTLGWALDVYMLAAAALVVLGGQIGDILGRRRITLVGIGLFAVGSVAVATSFSDASLIGGRALQGAGGAVLMPATMAVINDTFSKEESGTALGVWGAISMLAFAFGPLYGGFLTEVLSWRVIFWTDVALLLIAAALLFVSLRGLPGGRAGITIDVVGAILLGLGSFLVVLALQQGQSWGWTSGKFLLALATCFDGVNTSPAVSPRSPTPSALSGCCTSSTFMPSLPCFSTSRRYTPAWCCCLTRSRCFSSRIRRAA